ncbi:unnamed protein product [Fraxinus pennsylvanica]|uniref:Pentatricopeptide repeat-containing protein n=1 Tax=Fraxinus pennsylvanica TaxID=56036 RepID=A0AAD1YMK5_9LAMI|nr:unnamed protein product [Fraxinus pennsylvanica]
MKPLNATRNGGVPDNFTFSLLLKSCRQLGSVKLGKQMHCRIFKHGLENHVHLSNTLILMYGMLRVIGTAKELFRGIPESGLVAWNTVIDCHVYCGNYKDALEWFLNMHGSGMAFGEVTLVVVLSASSSLGGPNIDHYGSMLDSLGRGGIVTVAYQLIISMTMERNTMQSNGECYWVPVGFMAAWNYEYG